jgi:hypothetical protein
MPIKIEELQSLLIEAGIKDVAQRSAVIKAAQELENEKKLEREENKDGPKAKNRHVFFVRKDEKGNYSEAGWVAKIPQDSDSNTLLSRIQTAAAKQNDGGNKSGRGRKSKAGKISKYSEFFTHSKRKFTKEAGIQPLKDLIEVIILPTEEIDFSKS